MDAYSDYILRLTEARLSERRREAAEYSLSRAARKARGSVWTRFRGRGRRSRPSVVPMPELAKRVSAVEIEVEVELELESAGNVRRSA